MRIVHLGVLALLLMGATTTACDFGQKEREARLAAQEAEARRQAEEKARLDAKIKEQSAKIDSLLLELANAKDEATRLALQKQLESEREKQTGSRGVGPKASGATPCKCQPNDPLCS